MNALQRSLNVITTLSVDRLAAIANRTSTDSTLGSSRGMLAADLISAIKRYKAIGLWKKNLHVAPKAITDIQRLIIEGDGTQIKKHRCYDDIVDMQFALAAHAKYRSGAPLKIANSSAGCR